VNARFERLEQRMTKTEEKIDFFVRTSLPPVEGIFFNGQIFDAYVFVSDLIKSARQRIVLIDNYIDETVLMLMDKRNAGVTADIYIQAELVPRCNWTSIVIINNMFPSMFLHLVNPTTVSLLLTTRYI